jgi:uncharacterized membrane protein
MHRTGVPMAGQHPRISDSK